MTVDVNTQVRYTTGGVTVTTAKVAKIRNASLDTVDLIVPGTPGLVRNIPRSATGLTDTNDTWAYSHGGGKY